MKKQSGCLLALFIIFVAIPFFPIVLPIWAVLKLYPYFYFKSERFLALKQKLKNHTKECNELNEHIEELKSSALVVNRTDYGEANYHDDSSWQVNRTGMQKAINLLFTNVHEPCVTTPAKSLLSTSVSILA